MRFFASLNFQHLMGVLFPTLLFMLVFGVALSFSHFRSNGHEHRVIGRFADHLEERHGPFPLVMIWIIAGTFVWAIAYILMYGLSEVKL